MIPRTSVFAGLAALSLAVVGGPAVAQHSHGGGHQKMTGGHVESETGHSHQMAMVHGGEVSMTQHHHFEVVVTDTQARVYVYDRQQEPIRDLEDLRANMTLIRKDGKSETMDLLYMAPDHEKGRTQGYFFADRDMVGMTDGDMKAVVKLMGLEKEPVQFRTAVKIGHLMTYVCPMKDSPPAEDPGKCPKCGMEMTMMENGKPVGKATGKDSDHGQGESHGGHDH